MTSVDKQKGPAVAPVSIALNLAWIVLGGWWMALAWLVGAAIMAVSIIGLPWARAAFAIARYALTPFGHTVVARADYAGVEDLGTGPLGFLGNVVWLVLAGWWIALGHLATALGLAATLVGLPFAWAHLKLAALAVWPIGRQVVTTAERAQLRQDWHTRLR